MGNSSKQTNIAKRRRLEALYERGKNVRFDSKGVKADDAESSDEDVVIFVRPPSPLQREMAIREAQAERARVVLEIRRSDDGESYVTTQAFLASLDLEALVDYVVTNDENERLGRARRDVLRQKEWEDFNSLRDAMRQFEEAGSPFDDPEWAGLLEKDRKFGLQVTAAADRLRDGDRAGLALIPRPDLEKRALEKRIDQAASAAFMRSYEEAMLLYACRDDEDHSVLFFQDIPDMKSTPDEVQKALADTLASFINDAAEAKNSVAAGPGSPSSVQPKEPETSNSSSPEDSIGF